LPSASLAQRLDLRARRLHFRLAHLLEVLRRHVARQQTNDQHHHQQLEQGETALPCAALGGWRELIDHSPIP